MGDYPDRVTDIILDCDPGHDDAIALLLALGSPELNLLGVTTVSGNQTLEKTTANAIRGLDHVGRTRSRSPPAPSAARPRPSRRRRGARRDRARRPRSPPPSRPPEPAHAIDWIAMTLVDQREPVTLVPTGPLTNIALFLARYPGLAGRVERIVLMGGAIGEGNPRLPPSSTSGPTPRPRIACSRAASTSRWSGSTSRTRRCSDRPTSPGSGAPVRRGRSSRICSSSTSQFHRRRYGWEGAPVHDAVAMAHVIDAGCSAPSTSEWSSTPAPSFRVVAPTPTIGAERLGAQLPRRGRDRLRPVPRAADRADQLTGLGARRRHESNRGRNRGRRRNRQRDRRRAERRRA